MAKLNNEMKEMFAKQLPLIATINEDGSPNLGPKRSMRILDDETIIYNENTGGRTLRNIQRNPKVTVVIIDRENLDGYRFVGEAEVHEEGKYYEEAKEWAVGKMGVPKSAVVIKVRRIDTLKSGPTAGQTISE